MTSRPVGQEGHCFLVTSSAVLAYELPKYNIKMVLQISCFVMGYFLFNPELRLLIVMGIGQFLVFLPITQLCMKCFFHSRKGSLIKDFGRKNNQWHNTHFRKQKNSHKKFEKFYF